MRHASGSVIVAALLAGMLAAGACTKNNNNTPPSPTVTSVNIAGGNAVTVGQTLQLSATANFSDNTNQNVTTTATWESSNTGVATVSSGGLVTGVAAGNSDVRARFQNVTGTASLQVNAAAVVNPVAQFTVSTDAGAPNECRIIPNSGGDWDCRFDGSASTGGTGGAVTQWTWRFDVGANSGGPTTTNDPRLNPNPTCGYFNSRPGQTGTGFVQMIVKLQVRNAAGVLSAEVINNNVRLFPQNQCGFGF